MRYKCRKCLFGALSLWKSAVQPRYIQVAKVPRWYIYEGGCLRTGLRGGSISQKVHSFSSSAPIHSKLDFWSLWDLATQLKILSCSKILPELGDRALGSWKLPPNRGFWLILRQFWDNFTKGFIWGFSKIREFQTSNHYISELRQSFSVR